MYVGKLENCQNNISIYDCSPIQGKRLKFLLRFYEPRILECNILITIDDLHKHQDPLKKMYIINKVPILHNNLRQILSFQEQ